jgi:glutamate 5-kinase
MLSKILAAQVAQKKGIETWLLKGDTAAGLVKVAQNQVVGTKIGIHKGSKKSGSKKS